MEQKDVGILLQANDLKLQRKFFAEFVKLDGIIAQYRQPIPGAKQYNIYGELDAHFMPAIDVGCIYDTHPSQQSMRKMGWNAEIADGTTIIHVPYDLPGLQAGALFIIPAGLDNAPPRTFRVIRMSNIAVYPASIACELGPLLTNTTDTAVVEDFTTSNFNLLDGEQDRYGY